MSHDRASIRSIFRKNAPSETKENWQYIKTAGRVWARLFFLFVALVMLLPFAAIMYGKGYFDGVQAVRTETISKESHHVR